MPNNKTARPGREKPGRESQGQNGRSAPAVAAQASAAATSGPEAKPTVRTPSVKRRLLCLVYESLCLTAVEMFAMALYILVTLNRKGPLFDAGQKAVFILTAAAYFIHFWTDSGHTLAMKTWRIKVIKVGHAKLPLRTALLRFVLAWGWVLPAIVVCYAFGLKDPRSVSAALAVGILAWGMTAFLDKNRQFLHDRLAGTRLIQLPAPMRQASRPAGASTPDAA
jgi:uncharacterized RDD family membrane protein YckC